MKRMLSAGVLLLLVAALLVGGPTWLWRHFKATTDSVLNCVNQQMSDERVESLIRSQLQDLDKQIRQYHANIGRVADKLAAAEIRVEDIQRQLVGERDILARIKKLLDEERDRHEVGGRTYTRAEIKADGQAHLARAQRLEEQLVSQKKLVAQLRQGVDDGKATLANALRLKDEAAAELEALKTRLANARARQEIGDLTAALRDHPFNPDSDLAKRLAEFRDRARVAEHAVEFQTAETRGTGVVDWKGAAAPQDVSQSISRYLREENKTARGSR